VPSWSPGAGEPPLSVSAAIERAFRSLKPATPKEIQVGSISLESHLGPGQKYVWFYVVDYFDLAHLDPSGFPKSGRSFFCWTGPLLTLG
jgi:hypothetical protein